VVQQAHKARESVKGVSKTLENVSTQLDALSGSLQFLKKEPRLQTASIEKQVDVIINIATEMKLFFDMLEAKQKKSGIRQFAHALKSGDKDDEDLSGIVTRLSSAREELILRVSVVNVGLTGNVNDGFQVAQHVVMEINENVKRMLGTQLVLAERLKDRQLTITCQSFKSLSHKSAKYSCRTAQGMVQLEDSDIDALKLRTEAPISNEEQRETKGENLTWRNNKTGDEPRLFAGNMGLESSENPTPVKATVEDSEFGKGSRFMFGHIGGQSSQSFNENFWKS
jgi:hypothetical protein